MNFLGWFKTCIMVLCRTELNHHMWGCISCIYLWWLETPLYSIRNTVSGGLNHHNIGDLNLCNWWSKTLHGWCFESPFDSGVSSHQKWMQLMHPHFWCLRPKNFLQCSYAMPRCKCRYCVTLLPYNQFH